jgi:fatty acid desaturase
MGDVEPAKATGTATAGSARDRPTGSANLYTELAATIRQSGLLRRRYGFYWGLMALCIAACLALWVGVVLLGDSWFQLLPAAGLGVLMTQFGFLGHDAAHRQVFRRAAWNDWTARVLAVGFAGLSYGWWKAKHNRHHVGPNQEGLDPDIAPGAIVFTRALVEGRTGLSGWFARHQGCFFFPLLTLEGLNLHLASVRPLLQPGVRRQQRVESGVVVVRLLAYVVVLLLVLPLDKAAAFLAVQSAVFGLCLGGSFASGHKGMPIVPPASKIDFLRRQVLMSRNIRGGLLVDFVMGGLNYQIEHHLFPSMPRPNLRHAQPLVRDYCVRHQVSYTEVGLFSSYAIVVGYLNNVGLRARGPFECPFSMENRI